MKTTYPGIDYSGLGSTVNRDPSTGIRYGVISQRAIMPEALEDIYFGPHSKDLAYEAAVEEIKKQLAAAFDQHPDDKRGELGSVLKNFMRLPRLDERLEELMDCTNSSELWGVIEQDFNDGLGDNEVNPLFDDGEYRITKCLDSDLMILKSPYYTYAQMCSPCCPGACNLDSPLDESVGDKEGNKCYCLDKSWFENEEAPYPIYEVATGKKL